MKYTIVILAILGAVIAVPPYGRPQTVEVIQDTHGHYILVINTDELQRVEEGQTDGNVQGSYRYVDPDGNLQDIHYTAGVGGYQATGNNLPVAPKNTPEVEAARAEHEKQLKIFTVGGQHHGYYH